MLKKTGLQLKTVKEKDNIEVLTDDAVEGQDMMFLFGRNGHGELCRGHKHDLNIPVRVAPPVGTEVAHIAMGYEHLVCLTTLCDIYTAGNWVSGTQGDTEVHWDVLRFRRFQHVKNIPFIRVACGDQHCLALSITGELYSWGGTLHGKLGSNSTLAQTDSSSSSSTVVKTASARPSSFRTINVLLSKRVVDISCGREHSVVCTDVGEVYAFGSNKCGQLGLPNLQESSLPGLVSAGGISTVTAAKVSCGDFFTLVISTDGRLYAFGDNQFGQLGLDFSVTYQRTASEVTLLTRVGKVVSVATGRGFTLAVLASGAIYSFGFGQHGQLGHGECENSNRPKRIQSLGSYHIVSVAAGDRHSLAIDNEGACWSWGCNDRGQLGTGLPTSTSTPTFIPKFKDLKIVEIGAGCSHSLAMTFPFRKAVEMAVMVEHSRTRSNLALATASIAQDLLEPSHQRRISTTVALEKLELKREEQLDKIKQTLTEEYMDLFALKPDPNDVAIDYEDEIDIDNAPAPLSSSFADVYNNDASESFDLEEDEFENSFNLSQPLISLSNPIFPKGSFSKTNTPAPDNLFVSESSKPVAVLPTPNIVTPGHVRNNSILSQVGTASPSMMTPMPAPAPTVLIVTPPPAPSISAENQSIRNKKSESRESSQLNITFTGRRTKSIDLGNHVKSPVESSRRNKSVFVEVMQPNQLAQILTPAMKPSPKKKLSLQTTPRNDPSAQEQLSPLRLFESNVKRERPKIDSFRSRHVNMIHRYVVFEVDGVVKNPEVIQALVDEYVAHYTAHDKDLLFHNFVSTGLSFGTTPNKYITPLITPNKKRGIKHTIMFVSKYHSGFLPYLDWGDQFFDIFWRYSSKITFTEMLPME